MASHAYAHIRIARRRRPAAEDAPVQPQPRSAARPTDHARPTDVQLWNWTQGAVLFGYGPTAADFL
ncbi:hypothetical protein [Streptomyces sp. WG-D5]